MLRSLVIEDYGLIARAEIELASGPTIFTGETGSGKTMVLGAMAFVLGERAGADVVRRDAKRASVTLTFEPGAPLRMRFAADGFDIDSDEDALLQREMTQAGKSTLRLNGRPTTAGYVRELCANIADIIGQHEAQRLLAPAYHIELLDRFGGAALLSAADTVREAHAAFEEVMRELRALSERESKAQAELEFAQFAAEEIRSAAPEGGEDQRLNERRRYLDNIERITSALQTAHEALAGETGASDALGAASVALATIESIDRELGSMAQSARTLQEEAGELAAVISRQLDQTEFNAGELETLNARLDQLDRLKKKYGGTLEAVIEAGEQYGALVDTFANRDAIRRDLEARREKAAGALQTAAAKLTSLRTKAAAQLKARIERELPDLALPAAKFAAQFTELSQTGADGAETIEFVFSANAGEPLRPLVKVASGGELSRVLLALVVSVVESRGTGALIFDEIDSGIGGATATAVATRLARLGKVTQVILVTHLAQIASWAERHYVLEKHERAGTTTIVVREALNRGERADELARMLSGDSRGVALKHAEAMLQAAAGGA